MIVISDAGPLLALAKVGGLRLLFDLFPTVLAPPGVYEEAVTEGLRLGAPDAAVLDEAFRKGLLEISAPAESTALPIPLALGRGEREAIRLAIERKADWLLIDDLDARRGALANFQAAGVQSQVKGTLGVIVSACQQRHLARMEAIELVRALSRRQDVWFSSELCQRVIEILSRE